MTGMSGKRPTRSLRSRRRTSAWWRIGCVALVALLAAVVRMDAAAPRGVEADAQAPAAPPLAMTGFPLGLPRVRRTVELADPDALFVRLKEGGLIDGRIELQGLRDGGTAFVRPIASATVPVQLRAKLATSFGLALKQLNTRSACQGLFEQLHANGHVMLATTIYIASDGEHAIKMCDRAGGAAYTWLGQPATYLCPSFARLTRQDAAMSLLHEALHYAGLPERPVHRDAMSSREISALVRDRCGL